MGWVVVGRFGGDGEFVEREGDVGGGSIGGVAHGVVMFLATFVDSWGHLFRLVIIPRCEYGEILCF